ncbi:MAG: sigma-70 family RNA polymerase sigma factor, partial [Phycisphaera sp.]|nr:sigma-70 family RNA polymerase sigma factor [Phycisphaera sp.]
IRLLDGGKFLIKDLGSRSGTNLNWIRLEPDESVRIRTGDRIRFGSTECLVRLPAGDGPDEEPAADTPEISRTEHRTPPSADEFKTRGSLLLRLNASGTLEREIGWRDFYDRYVPLIKGFAGRAGAGGDEAEDVAHEVVANFFRASHRFEYDAAQGRFRGYLKAATLNAMRARWRKRGDQVNLGEHDEIRIDDPGYVEDVWAQEWTRSVIERALEAVRSSGNQSEQSWEAFDLYGRRGVPVAEVAERLSMSPEAIRQAKSRISRQVRAEIERIRTEEG